MITAPPNHSLYVIAYITAMLRRLYFFSSYFPVCSVVNGLFRNRHCIADIIEYKSQQILIWRPDNGMKQRATGCLLETRFHEPKRLLIFLYTHNLRLMPRPIHDPQRYRKT